MNKLIGLVAVLVIVAGGYVFYSGNVSAPEKTAENEGVDAAAMPATDSEGTPEMVVADEGVKEFTITSTSFSFTPSEMKVKKGDKVRIVLKNVTGTHDFVLDEFGAKTKKITGAGEDTIEFTADKAGTFEYYCSVGNHRAMGMKGTLTVE